MKITNVAHFISKAGKQLSADNIHFIVRGAKLEVLQQINKDYVPGFGNVLKEYKNWLKSAEYEINSKQE